MRRFMILAGVCGLLAVPAAAQAGETPSQNASQECRSERGTTAATREAFAAKYATNKHKTNAFGKCVSAKARELKQESDDQDRTEAAARKNAAKHVSKLAKAQSGS